MSPFAFFQKVAALANGVFLSPSRTTVDHRRVKRRLYMRQGFLTFPNRPAYPPADCLIRDLSPVGAQIEVTEAGFDERLFTEPARLFIADKKHERDCQIVWRREFTVGFKFVGKPVSPTRDYRPLTQRGGGLATPTPISREPQKAAAHEN